MSSSKISFISALLISMNIMVGAGIYISPPDMALAAGDLSYLGWFAAFLLFLPVVLSLSKLAAYYPGEGGMYRYIKETLGVFPGFLGAWVYFLGFVGAQSLQSLALRELVSYHLGSEFLIQNPWLFNLSFLAVLFFLSRYPMKMIAKVQSAVTLLKLLPLFFVIGLLVVLPGLGGGELIESVDEAARMPEAGNFAEALALIWKTIPYAIFGYWGFEACTNISHRISGSKKNASRVILLSFLVVCTLYTLFHFEVLRVMGSYGLYHQKVENFLSYAGWTSALALKVGFLVFSACLSISYFNVVLSELLSYSFVVQVLASEKKIIGADKLSKFNKNDQPIPAILLNCVLTFLIMTFVPGKDGLVALTNIGIVISFVFCLISLLKLSLKNRDYIFSFIAVLGFVSCYFVAVFSLSLLDGLQPLVPLFVLIILGALAHILSLKKRKA